MTRATPVNSPNYHGEPAQPAGFDLPLGRRVNFLLRVACGEMGAGPAGPRCEEPRAIPSSSLWPISSASSCKSSLCWLGPALLFRQTEDKSAVGAFAITTAIIIGLVLLVWWTGVRTLSRAGIHGTLARTVALTVVIPFGYAFAIAIPIVAFGILASLDELRPEIATAGLLLLAEAAIVLLVVGLGYMTHRIVATAERLRELMPPEQPAPPA